MSYYIQVIVPPPVTVITECISTVNEISQEKNLQLIIAGAYPKPTNYAYLKPYIVYGICQPKVIPAVPEYTITLLGT